jgi:hypothetical protein
MRWKPRERSRLQIMVLARSVKIVLPSLLISRNGVYIEKGVDYSIARGPTHMWACTCNPKYGKTSHSQQAELLDVRST